MEKALQHAYKGRKLNKRNARTTWITKINAGARMHSITYSQLVHGLKVSNIALNRKILSDLAHHEPLSFDAVVENAKEVAGLEDRTYPNHGYIQSVTLTHDLDPFEYPRRPRGTPNPSMHAERNKFDKRKPLPEILDREPFFLPMQSEYVQRALPSILYDFSSKQQKKIDKQPKLTRQEEAHWVATKHPAQHFASGKKKEAV